MQGLGLEGCWVQGFGLGFRFWVSVFRVYCVFYMFDLPVRSREWKSGPGVSWGLSQANFEKFGLGDVD